MKQTELKLMIDGQTIAGLSLTRAQAGLDIWEISVTYNPGSHHAEYYGSVLTNNNKTQKVYTSLDRATDAVRKLGYQGVIEIHG